MWEAFLIPAIVTLSSVRAHIVPTTKPRPEPDHLCIHCCLACLLTSCETREKVWKAWEQFNVAVLLVSSQNPRSSHKCTKACANKDLPPVSMHVHRHTNSLWKMLKRLTAWGRQILMPNLGGPVSCVQKDAVRWMFSIWIAGLPN